MRNSRPCSFTRATCVRPVPSENQGIGDDGAEALAEALKSNVTLNTLVLWSMFMRFPAFVAVHGTSNHAPFGFYNCHVALLT